MMENNIDRGRSEMIMLITIPVEHREDSDE